MINTDKSFQVVHDLDDAMEIHLFQCLILSIFSDCLICLSKVGTQLSKISVNRLAGRQADRLPHAEIGSLLITK